MTKLLSCLVLALLMNTFTLNAEYDFAEQVAMQLPKLLRANWQIGYQRFDENGACCTRYFLEYESPENWMELVNIQFKDRTLIEVADALDAMQMEADQSMWVTCTVLSQADNDMLYERFFPTGEHEIVRMIMTEKGLHRIAYVKRGLFPETERLQWIERLQQATIRLNH